MGNTSKKSLAISQTLFFICMTAFFGISGILLFFLPQRTYSENENRYLTTFQKPSFSSFMDASMQENLTKGADDQFFLRDFWMECATAVQKGIGFKDAGGVYFGRDGYYLERMLDSDLSKSRYANNLRYLEQFASNCQKGRKSKVVFLPVPSAGVILPGKLPAYGTLYDADRLYSQAEAALKQAEFIDIRPDLLQESKNSQIYFKTDHHWTMYGAYTGYSAWCSAHGHAGRPLEQFGPECASETFYGTLYSKAPAFFTQPDMLYIPKNLLPVQVQIDEQKPVDSIYKLDKLAAKDKYGVYFGGNFAKIKINTAGADQENKGRLLIIKDSFANSMVPFLINEGYNEIMLLDLRYYNDSVSKLVQTEQPDEVLVLYEMSNFAQDMNFFKILK